MNQVNSSADPRFVELRSFEHVSSVAATTKSNVVKSASVKDGGTVTIEVIDGSGSEPTIHIHRVGDNISKIEFVCACGKSTHLDLEYEEE